MGINVGMSSSIIGLGTLDIADQGAAPRTSTKNGAVVIAPEEGVSASSGVSAPADLTSG